MTVRINKSAFNIREKLSELERPIGLKGSELMRAETAQEARNLVSAGRKNLIINGAMTVHQRGSNLTSGGYIADRWSFNTTSLDQWAGNATWETDAPDGFSRSIKMNTTTAETSFESGDELSFEHRIEAQDLQHLDWGTANAKSLTLSFWVKCNKTGTQSIHVRAHDASDGYSTSYSINSADTWEYKTIVIPGNTAGSINNDTGIGIWIRWIAADGDTANTENAWDTSNIGPYAVSGAMAFGTTIGDYLQITGVQLEVGKNATEFEHRSYGEELALCQRYYYRVYGGRYEWRSSDYTTYRNGSLGSGSHPVTMRQAPTMGHNLTGNSTNTNPSNAASPVGAWSWYSWATGWGTSSSINSGTIANWSFEPTTNGWAGGIYYFSPSNYSHVTHMQISSQSYIEANAEL
jgi:hypothetical protein